MPATQNGNRHQTEVVRKGLYIRGHRADPEVRRSMVRLAKWLRTRFEFPIRVPVYLSPNDRIRTAHGMCSASFFAPWKLNIEPFIRIATGDYISLKAEVGRDDALAAILCSLAHEVIHYQQWRLGHELSERGVIRTADQMIRAYAKSVLRP